jgi:hypothetical protein
LAGQFTGERFQARIDREGIVKFLDRQRPNDGAAIVIERYQPFKGEYLLCLALGRARDAELFAEILFRHLRLGRQLIGNDEIPKAAQKFVMKMPS